MSLTTVQRLHADFGALITGFDVARDNSDAAAEALLGKVHKFGLVLLEAQHPTDVQLVALSRQLGEPLPGYRAEFTHPKYPELVRLGNVRDLGFSLYLNTQGEEWHSDATGTDKAPGVTILNAVETPKTKAQTLFSSTVAALQHLPAELRQRIEGLTVVHNFDRHNDVVARFAGTNVSPRDASARQHSPDVRDKLVQRHPVTGQEHLLLSPQLVKRIEGLNDAQTAHLLPALLREVRAPARVLKFEWRPGQIVIFDNRTMMHSATPYDYADQRRYLRQIIITARDRGDN